LLLVVLVTAASAGDRDGGRRVLERLRFAMPSVALVWADGGYTGRLVRWAKDRLRLVLQVVRKPADQQGFAGLPRRPVVERTLSWLMRNRRLIRDYERLPESHEAMVKWAMIGLMTRRLAPEPGRRPGRHQAPPDPFSNTFSVVNERRCQPDDPADTAISKMRPGTAKDNDKDKTNGPALPMAHGAVLIRCRR